MPEEFDMGEDIGVEEETTTATGTVASLAMILSIIAIALSIWGIFFGGVSKATLAEKAHTAESAEFASEANIAKSLDEEYIKTDLIKRLETYFYTKDYIDNNFVTLSTYESKLEEIRKTVDDIKKNVGSLNEKINYIDSLIRSGNLTVQQEVSSKDICPIRVKLKDSKEEIRITANSITFVDSSENKIELYGRDGKLLVTKPINTTEIYVEKIETKDIIVNGNYTVLSKDKSSIEVYSNVNLDFSSSNCTTTISGNTITIDTNDVVLITPLEKFAALYYTIDENNKLKICIDKSVTNLNEVKVNILIIRR